MSLENAAAIIALAKQGDATALKKVVTHCQYKLHRLSIRMVVDPGLAEDATQEILIRIVTNLASFRGDASFDTWAYRIAINYLLTAKKVLQRDPNLTFSQFSDDLLDGLTYDRAPMPDEEIMLNQLRIKCTMAMLMCLDAKHRAAYVLGEILEFDHVQASEILDVSKVTFRQQLRRARSKILEFTSAYCGLVRDDAPCSCERRLSRALELGRINHADVYDFSDAPSYKAMKFRAQKLSEELRVAKLQRATGALTTEKDFGSMILGLIDP